MSPPWWLLAPEGSSMSPSRTCRRPIAPRRAVRAGMVGVALCAFALTVAPHGNAQKTPAEPGGDYATTVRPLLATYCLECHSTKLKKGSLDLERFASAADVRKDLKIWEVVIEQLEAEEMPPKTKAKRQPTAEERRGLIAWARDFRDAEARDRAGDPGNVPLRRLSNAEYNYTIRDLTGVDLQPAREFPADGAAGEGFTNAAEALTEISPALLTKYLNAAKDIAEHAVLLPDEFRFSASKTRRDWTDESTARLRQFYAAHASGDGRLPVQPYLAATVRHRDALQAGNTTIEEVAGKEKLNASYLGILWKALTDKNPSQPLEVIRARWRTATEKDVVALAGNVAAWQSALWKTVRIGNYIQPVGEGYSASLTRQVATDPPAFESVPLRVAVKRGPDQTDVVLHLAARELAPGGGHVIWQSPRFEAP